MIIMDCLHPNNGVGAKHIHEMTVSDHVSDGDNTDDRTEWDEDCAELWEGDFKSAEGAMLDGDCCNAL
jgi:hypothetical protein